MIGKNVTIPGNRQDEVPKEYRKGTWLCSRSQNAVRRQEL